MPCLLSPDGEGELLFFPVGRLLITDQSGILNTNSTSPVQTHELLHAFSGTPRLPHDLCWPGILESNLHPRQSKPKRQDVRLSLVGDRRKDFSKSTANCIASTWFCNTAGDTSKPSIIQTEGVRKNQTEGLEHNSKFRNLVSHLKPSSSWQQIIARTSETSNRL